MVIMNPESPVPMLYLNACFLLITASFMVVAQNSTTVPVNVGVVLDMNSWVGKMWLSCIDMSLSDFYSSNPHFTTRIVLHPRDSRNDVVGAAAAALDLIKNKKVQAILGPTSSIPANFVIEMGEKAHVPIVTFTATSPSLAFLRSPYFFRVAQNDSAQVDAISAIVKQFGWRQVVPVYEDDEFGEAISPSLIDALLDVNSQVPYRSVINPAASDDQIVEELYKLKTMPTRVFVVHMVPKLAARIFVKAKEIGLMDEGYVWILTGATSNQLTSMDSSVLNAMNGALAVKTYFPTSKELEYFKIQWNRKFLQDNHVMGDPQLDLFGLWAYDAAQALAMAVENIGTTNSTFDQNPNPSNNLKDLRTLEISQNGPKLRDSLSNTQFRGLSGDFSIVNGQLQSSNFEIVNLNSNGGRVVGFWTPANGLTKDFKQPGTRHINWPGDSISTPKGWEIPTKGKRLKIGVPVKKGYSEFVKVHENGSVVGFCIDVFDEVVKALPYDLRFDKDYIPFALPNRSSAGSSDDLIMKVHDGTYDAVVGDITIIAKRSLYVDFSLPFTESGVLMVVPVKVYSKNKAWVFLEPLTWDLWATSICFFVFMGFVVWILEHRINEAFRGPPSHQIGTSLWFSFCTMAFAQRETLVSNMARFVVVIWFFVVLILTQSYTASLTSLLTVQQLQPTVTDVDQIIKNNMAVGYHDGSFVRDLLKTTLGLKNLKDFGSPEELHELFKLGTSNGGIDAAFDEIPYIKLFLSKYSDKYTVTEPNYRIDGFGFAFPIGSPLVGNITRAVLNVTESEIMNKIQQKWLRNERNTPFSSLVVSSSQLSLSSFWGLFLIAGSSAAVAILIYLFIFLSKEKHNLDSDTSAWKKFMVLFKIYDGKDLTSHTFKRSHQTNRSGFGNNVDGSNVVSFEASPRSQYPPSPWMESVRDQSFEFFNGGSSPRNEASPDVAAVIELGPINEESEEENK